MAANAYVTRMTSEQLKELSMSHTVTILSHPEEKPKNRQIFSDRIRATSTFLIEKEDQNVTDVIYESVEEIRSIKNGDLLQVTGKFGTYFIKFQTRDALKSWLDYLQRTLRVSGISRSRPYHSERHIRPHLHQDLQKKHLSTQDVEQNYSRYDDQGNRRRDGVIYDDPSSLEYVSEYIDAGSLVSDDYVNTNFHRKITTGPRTRLVIENVHGNIIINGDSSKDLYGDQYRSSKSPYECLSSQQNTSAVYQGLRQTHNNREETIYRIAEESDWGPAEGMFETDKPKDIEEGDYDVVPPAVPARPMVNQFSQVKKEQEQGIVNRTIPKTSCRRMKFSSKSSFVYISDTPKTDNSFYVGDKVQSINGHEVGADTAFVERLINTSVTKDVVLTLKRLPEAEIGLIRRHSLDQNIGITLKDTKIKSVTKGSLFSEKFGYGCHRCITHINGTYFRYGTSAENVHQFLSGCGLEVAIVLQPSNFVKELTHGTASGKKHF
ncbi:hypothetical protein HOLleu_12989 [Holothuria leucospilota]|uniref:PDZ domain-containing protein n=1 Tax=Holothuria leucospilota TaxID=206669 RepID=A0A9Q1CBR0_HOLLE|nr:hypothetical protein HOLleu_12989 [Holothuria leucospilota]